MSITNQTKSSSRSVIGESSMGCAGLHLASSSGESGGPGRAECRRPTPNHEGGRRRRRSRGASQRRRPVLLRVVGAASAGAARMAPRGVRGDGASTAVRRWPEAVGVAKPVHQRFRFEQLGFEIAGGQQVPVDRVRRLGHVESRDARPASGGRVVVLREERSVMADRSHSDGKVALDGAPPLRSTQRRCVAAGSAFAPVHLVAGPGEVVTDARGDELIASYHGRCGLDWQSHPSVGDDVVAPAKPLGVLSSGTRYAMRSWNVVSWSA